MQCKSCAGISRRGRHPQAAGPCAEGRSNNGCALSGFAQTTSGRGWPSSSTWTGLSPRRMHRGELVGRAVLIWERITVDTLSFKSLFIISIISIISVITISFVLLFSGVFKYLVFSLFPIFPVFFREYGSILYDPIQAYLSHGSFDIFRLYMTYLTRMLPSILAH